MPHRPTIPPHPLGPARPLKPNPILARIEATVAALAESPTGLALFARHKLRGGAWRTVHGHPIYITKAGKVLSGNHPKVADHPDHAKADKVAGRSVTVEEHATRHGISHEAAKAHLEGLVGSGKAGTHGQGYFLVHGAGRPEGSQQRPRGGSAVAERTTRTAKPTGPKPDEHADHEAGHVGNVPAHLIHADPHRFQYKLGHSESGAVGSLAGVKKYDPDLAGLIQVWRDPADKKTYVVNGHNRLDLAKKLGAEKVTVRYIEAKDAAEARSKGAITNIAEVRGTAIDAAKYFRDSGLSREDVAAKGIPMREKIATDGLALSKLEPATFKRVVDGDISAERGAIIGGKGLEHHEQAALVKLLDKQPKGKEITNRHLEELVDEVKSARSVRQHTADLFGGHEDDQSLALHKTKLQATIKERLGKEKRLFGTVAKSKHADELSRAGNKIDVDESAKVSHQAGEALGIFDHLKNRSGPVSRALNDGAERIARGENARKVTEEIYRHVLTEIPKTLRGAEAFGP